MCRVYTVTDKYRVVIVSVGASNLGASPTVVDGITVRIYFLFVKPGHFVFVLWK